MIAMDATSTNKFKYEIERGAYRGRVVQSDQAQHKAQVSLQSANRETRPPISESGLNGSSHLRESRCEKWHGSERKGIIAVWDRCIGLHPPTASEHLMTNLGFPSYRVSIEYKRH